jgi:hypothetical protein
MKNKTESKLSTAELHAMKMLMRVFEYTEYCNRGYKKISGGYSKAGILDVDDTHVRFELSIGVQDGHENPIPREHYRISRIALAQEEHPSEFIESDEGIPDEVIEEPTPADKIIKLKVQQGAIVLPEGYKGKDVKQINKAFKLKLLKHKVRMQRRVERTEFHTKQNLLMLEQKAREGKLKFVGKRLKKQ